MIKKIELKSHFKKFYDNSNHLLCEEVDNLASGGMPCSPEVGLWVGVVLLAVLLPCRICTRPLLLVSGGVSDASALPPSPFPLPNLYIITSMLLIMLSFSSIISIDCRLSSSFWCTRILDIWWVLLNISKFKISLFMDEFLIECLLQFVDFMLELADFELFHGNFLNS